MSDSESPLFKILRFETNFAKRAKRPGGVKRDEALERAETLIQESEPDYLAAMDADIAEVLKTFTTPKIAEPTDTDVFGTAYSTVSRIRDMGGTFGFHLLTESADSFCTLLDRLSDQKREGCALPPARVAEAIHCHVDAITLTRQSEYRNCQPNSAEDLLSGLRHVVDACCPPDSEEEPDQVPKTA